MGIIVGGLDYGISPWYFQCDSEWFVVLIFTLLVVRHFFFLFYKKKQL